MIIDYQGFGHISIVVKDIYKSTAFYSEHFGAIPIQEYPNFSQSSFTQNLGFSNLEKEVNLTTVYLLIPQVNLFFEMMQYHYPKSESFLIHDCANDLGVINHLSFRVNNINEIFEYFKHVDGIEFLNTNKNYRPMQLKAIKTSEFNFFDKDLESNQKEKETVCNIIGTIKFFIIKDFNGFHWEFEQGHADIGG